MESQSGFLFLSCIMTLFLSACFNGQDSTFGRVVIQ